MSGHLPMWVVKNYKMTRAVTRAINKLLLL